MVVSSPLLSRPDPAPAPGAPTAQASTAETHKPRVLGISIYDGIGPFWLLFAPFVDRVFEWAAQVSCETDPSALRVLEHRFKERRHRHCSRVLRPPEGYHP